ncbi:hypothetical protein OW763_14115 [Clostridium aestuarii]|uniref:CRISPR-associated protein Csx10 n=1 Tax=Clostridium aestuarii TaxID=338193 RepID=A0ABT4D5J3_9CLOT|nr:hypothetical protein [Clostridium aestuarii]MCY6485465.1 hypothetical protein [Clostridium aestuarii]
MSNYITYTLENKENIKLANTIVQSDSQTSMDYISGSAIRGAYIAKYIAKKGVYNINQGEHRKKLLNGGIKFLNAYPMDDEERAIPFPKCFFCNKDEIKKFQYEEYETHIDLTVGIDNQLEDNYEKVRSAEFVGIDDNEYEKIKVTKCSNLHISKQGNKNEKNKLFRYDAIKKGHKFKGIIQSDNEEYLQEVKELLEDSIVYIGGAKGSGYGKCLISDIEIVKDNPEFEYFDNTSDFEDVIYLFAMSDIIYRSNLGEYKTFIDEEYLKNQLGLEKVEYLDSCIETKITSGFNNKWNCSIPQVVSIKAGSVFKYKIYGDIDEEKLQRFIDIGIGERKSEGYGRVVILNALDDTVLNKTKEREVEIEISDLIENLNENDVKQLSNIFTSIYEYKVESKINKVVLDIYNNLKNPNKLNNNQWGNLYELLSSVENMSIDRGKNKVRDYINHIKEKNGNSLNQLKNVKHGQDRTNFIDYLEEYINQSDDVKEFTSKIDVNEIQISSIKSKLDREFVYRTNIKIIRELCRYHLRKEDKQ